MAVTPMAVAVGEAGPVATPIRSSPDIGPRHHKWTRNGIGIVRDRRRRRVSIGDCRWRRRISIALLNRWRTISRRLVLSLGWAFRHKVGGFCRVKSNRTERERA